MGNARILNRTLNEALEALQQHFILEKASTAPYDVIKLNLLLKFNVEQYNIRNLGNLCIMRMNAGIMQMVTFVLTPYEKDMPMMSADYIYIMGNRKGILEFYDLGSDSETAEYQGVLHNLKAVVDGYSDLNDYESNPAWYDSLLTVKAYKACDSSQDGLFMRLLIDAVKSYAHCAELMPALTEEQKADKTNATRQYCDDMVTKGGVSTDMFRKKLGEDTTRDFFKKVFFGTDS